MTPDAGSRDEATEERILRAAHRVFTRRGTAGARTQEIADEAGVNKAMLHYYFRTKEGLAEAVFRRAARRLLPPILAVLGSDAPLEEKVRRFVEIEIDTLLANPFLPGYILAELSHHPERAAHLIGAMAGAPVETFAPRVFEALGGQLRAEAAAGRIRPLDARHFLMHLASLCIFPFAARPMFSAMLGIGDDEYRSLMEARKEEIPRLFLEGIRVG